jgi:integrase
MFCRVGETFPSNPSAVRMSSSYAKRWSRKGPRFKRTASRRYSQRFFSFAVDAELVSANPCARLKKRSKETVATGVLSEEEIRLFWRRIGDPPNSKRIGQALRLVLLTGVRITELTGAELKEFERLDDARSAKWTIPASRSKNGKAHVVPLSGQALSIVADLVKLTAATAKEVWPDRHLLPSPADPKHPIDGHALSVAMIRFGSAVKAGMESKVSTVENNRAVETWALDRPSAHDLRRTFATRLAGAGVPAEDISACLNHTRTGVTARHYDLYDRAREKRRAFELWGQQVARIIEASTAG